MTEYIRREDVHLALDNHYFTGELSLKETIDSVPSADVIEREKGKWIPVTNGRGGFECDQCHNYAPSYQDGVEWLSGFCPNCGADMRGREDERTD